MEISPTTTSLSASATQNKQSESDISKITSDFDTFLKMLTAQITNQDPLNPINSEQFAVQLATFSGVEQQVRTNELLESLSGKLGETGFGQMAAWVGMEARAPMPAYYSGAPLAVLPTDPIAGDRHELVARNANGSEIWRAPYTQGTGPVQWAGVRSDGIAAPDGTYSFRLESFEGDRLVATEEAQTYGAVQEVRIDPRGPVLVFGGGIERLADTVSALRKPTIAARS